MATREDSRRYLENWQDEIDSAAEYRAMAESEPDARLARVYGNLARMEEVHITFWEDKLRQAGVEVGSRRPSWRSRVLRWIGRRLGPQLGHGRGRSRRRRAADPRHGPGGPARWRVLDGARGVGLGDELS